MEDGVVAEGYYKEKVVFHIGEMVYIDAGNNADIEGGTWATVKHIVANVYGTLYRDEVLGEEVLIPIEEKYLLPAHIGAIADDSIPDLPSKEEELKGNEVFDRVSLAVSVGAIIISLISMAISLS